MSLLKRPLLRLGLTTILIAATFFAAQRPIRAQTGDSIVLADSGFRPSANGFQFENYGNEDNPQNLTPESMQRLLGNAVCANKSGSTCILTPTAEAWMDEQNTDMDGGHCEGMAVLSLMLYTKTGIPVDLGVKRTIDVPFENSTAQAEIAYWFATQSLFPTSEAEIRDKTPNEIVDILIEAMKAGYTKPNAQTYVMGIYEPNFDGGHAITPYAVLDRGGDIVWIMVYDNNYPNEERFIEVDRAADTWTYTGSTKPDEPPADYSGDATTMNLTLTPQSVRLQPQECPFCADQGNAQMIPTEGGTNGGLFLSHMRAARQQYVSIYLQGEGDLLIATADGAQMIGFKDGKLVNTFAGATYALGRSGLNDDSPEPVYYIPLGADFVVTIDGSRLKAETQTSVTFFGPGYVLSADEIKLAPGEQDTVDITADGMGLTYSPSASESPSLSIGFEAPSDDYLFTVKGADLEPQALINMSVDTEKGQLILDTTGNTQVGTYSLTFNRIDDVAESTFTTEDISLEPDDTVYINYAKWTGEKATLEIGLDAGGDGTIDETTTLTDSQ